MIRRWLLILGLAAGANVCVPDIGAPPSEVGRTRVLAVRFEPAEARPGDSFVATALVAGPEGEVEEPAIAWATCVAPKRPVDSGSVTTLCLGDTWPSRSARVPR